MKDSNIYALNKPEQTDPLQESASMNGKLLPLLDEISCFRVLQALFSYICG